MHILYISWIINREFQKINQQHSEDIKINGENKLLIYQKHFETFDKNLIDLLFFQIPGIPLLFLLFAFHPNSSHILKKHHDFVFVSTFSTFFLLFASIRTVVTSRTSIMTWNCFNISRLPLVLLEFTRHSGSHHELHGHHELGIGFQFRSFF